MWSGKHKVSLLTLGVVVSSIGLIQTLTHSLDLGASNDGESEGSRSTESESTDRVR